MIDTRDLTNMAAAALSKAAAAVLATEEGSTDASAAAGDLIVQARSVRSLIIQGFLKCFNCKFQA